MLHNRTTHSGGPATRFNQILCGLCLLVAALFANLDSANAQSQDWETLIVQMSETDPDIAAQWETAKKTAEKEEKNLKDFSDTYFQNSFDAVFGDGNFKPSEGLDLLKVLEAASGGDAQYAAEGLSEFIIAKYTPGLGQYISLMKTVASGIQSIEQVWINGLKDTQAYENFTEVLFSNPNYDRPYIPSYMITYLRNNQTYGAHISLIYDEMRAREDAMFEQWASDEMAVGQMRLPSWSSRWISAVGKPPTEKQIFNYFLYDMVKNSKAQYLEKFSDIYMEPLVRQEARQQRMKMNNAMRSAIAQIASAASTSDSSAQCETWNQQYSSKKAETDRLSQNIGTYLDGVYQSYSRKYDAMVTAENVAFKRLSDPLTEERDALKRENEALDDLEDAFDSALATLQSMRADVRSLESTLPADKSDPNYNGTIAQINARVESYNDYRSSTFMPAKSAFNEAVSDFNVKNDAFKVKWEAFWDDTSRPPKYAGSQKLVQQFSRIRQSIQGFQKGEFNCRPFAKLAVDDGMNALIGVDPTPGINMCATWLSAAKDVNALGPQIREHCK